MSIQTAGRAFSHDQIKLLQDGRTDELIDARYLPRRDPGLVCNVVRGIDSLKQYFRTYMAKPGKLEVLSLGNFVETPESILFEATVRTSAGQAKVYEGFVLRDGKATHRFTGLK